MSRSHFLLKTDRRCMDVRDEARFYTKLVAVREIISYVMPDGTLNVVGWATSDQIGEFAAEYGEVELL